MAKRTGTSRKKAQAPSPAPVSLDPVVRALENLRRHRVWGDRARDVGGDLAEAQSRLERTQESLGAILGVWESTVPSALRERAWPSALSRRVLTVIVEDAATGYELSMWLRGGGEASLRTAAKTAISRVKVEVGE